MNLFTNAPVHETLEILRDNLEQNKTLHVDEIDEIINLLRLILAQNYFTFNGKYYIQNEDLAMGSPLSGFLADVYLNHYENKYIFSDNNRYNMNIIQYARYVDDTFIIYNGTIRQLNNLKSYLNSINNNIQFTLEVEENDSINFLDITVSKNSQKFEFNIYRKPTTTDTVIHADSHHPFSQKMASFHSFVHRLLTVPLNENNYNNEIHTLKHIAIVNGYNSNIIDKLINKHKNFKSKPESEYISATYGNHTPFILVNTFRKFNYQISFRTNNKLLKLLNKRPPIPLNKKSGIYKITCDDCDCFYIGQTGRSFVARFPEHLPPKNPRTPIILDKVKSNFARHIIDKNHSCTSLMNNLTPIHICDKGNIMNALEEYEIYKVFKNKEQKNFILNDQLIFKCHSLFDTAIKINNNNNVNNNKNNTLNSIE